MKTINCAQIGEDGRQEFYTIAEAYNLLSISRKTLYRYIAIAIVSDAQFKAEWDYINPRKKGRKITPYQLETLRRIKNGYHENSAKVRDKPKI